MGKLGGIELNYSSDIDLIFLYDADGQTDGAAGSMTNHEFFDRLARDVVRLLTEITELGHAYRVDLRLRPEGERRARSCISLEGRMHYYDVLGRTWERQAYVKARPVAGDLDLGPRVSRTPRAVDLSPLPRPGRHHRHQGAQAAHRAATHPRRRRRCATSRPATAAFATSSS